MHSTKHSRKPSGWIFALAILSFASAPALSQRAPAPAKASPVTVAPAAARSLVKAARSQVGVTLRYDPAYEQISFPGGDVARHKGVCTDVVIRALRESRAMDLQLLIHDDMKLHPAAYSKRSKGARVTIDRNIDHRRVPNIMTYFDRRGFDVKASSGKADFQPGDVVTWDLGRGLRHIGIVTERKSWFGRPLVVHNIGRGAQEEDILNSWPILGHYRLPSRV